MKQITGRSAGIFLSCLMLLTAGCASTQTSKPMAEKKVITIWSSDRHDMDIRRAQSERFNSENKDHIEIKFEVKADGIANMLQLAYQSGEAPDIHSHLPGTMMKTAVEGGWIKELPERLAERYREEFVPGIFRYYSGDRKIYSIATSMNTYKLVWNKDLFQACGLDPEKYPKTWDEVIEYAKIITQQGKGQKYGFALPMKENFGVTTYVVNPGAPSGYYNINGFDIKENKYDFNVFKPMMNVMLKLKSDGSLFPTPDTLNNDMARAQFSEGNIGIMVAATYDIGVFNDQFPAKIDFGVADYPTFDGAVSAGGGYLYDITGSSFQMNASSRYPDEQLKVFEWLNSEEVIKELSLAGKGVYAHQSVFNNPEYMVKDKKGGVGLSSFTEPFYILPPIVPNQLVKIEGAAYKEVIGNILCFDSSGMDAKLDDLNKRYNAAYKKLAEDGIDISRFHAPDYNPNISTQ